MAEEVQYASEPGSNKRKYEDPTSPSLVSRRRTGFSAPISSLSPADASAAAGTPPRPTSYNSVAPLMDDFQLAKQKAQEIAARILNNSDPTKARAINNGGSVAFEAREPQKPLGSSFLPSGTSSYGYPGPTKKIEIPNTKVGVIIGRSGETIRNLQVQSGAKIQVTRDMDADPNSQTRGVELMGTPDQIAKAEQLIQDVLSEADSGSSGIASRRFTGQQIGSEQFVMRVPNNKVGLVIGKGGETIKNMQATTGARIQVIPLHLPPGDTSTERTVQIDGSSDQIEQAKQLVNEAISESRVRNPGMTGTYPQQGYQTRPPNSWAPQTQQQPGYGYMQPGMYPGQSPQFNMPQPPYPGYPPQPPAGGYGPGWDPSSQNQQTAAAGGGYDYYSQVPPQQQTPGGSGGQTDNSAAYGYSQQPSSGYNNQGQTYSQDGYGGGYNTPAPQSGGYAGSANYDQQHGYGGGNSSAPAPDGQTVPYGTHGDGSEAPPQTNQNPSPNAKYPHQGTAQPGYGIPPTQPPVYSASSYGQPTAPTSQPAYGPAQSGYGQPDYGSQRPPSTGYGAPANQTGYAPTPPYGVPPPMAQSGAPYNSGHGGSGYPQSSAYPPGGAAAGGAYDTAPASQSAGSAKTSPQN